MSNGKKNTDRRVPIAADVPEDAEILEDEPFTGKELMSMVTCKLPEDYESLVICKKKKIEAVLEGMLIGQTMIIACKNADMSYPTFHRMRAKYQIVQSCMDVIIGSRLQVVEDSLYRSAIGYEYETTEVVTEDVIDKEGKSDGSKKRREKRTTHHVPAQATACIFFLKNLSRGKYRSDHHIRIQTSHTERRELAVDVNVKAAVTNMTIDELRQVKEMSLMIKTKIEEIATDIEPTDD